VLGDNFTFTQYFPGYVAVSLIDIADFLQRIEVAVGAVLFMGAFVKITIYLYVVSLGLSKVLGFGDYRRFVAPVGILMLTLSVFAYGNIVENVDFASGFFPYYGFSFRILIPVAVWILAERKRKKLKREGRLPEPPPAEEETPVERQGGNAPQNTEQAADSPVDGRPQPS
jgi:spore germination protein KB